MAGFETQTAHSNTTDRGHKVTVLISTHTRNRLASSLMHPAGALAQVAPEGASRTCAQMNLHVPLQVAQK